MLTLSIVIPVRNGERTLPACFAALDQLNPAPAEIIFVDNGSTDRTPELLSAFQRTPRPLPVIVLQERTLGASAARNTGIRAATGDLVVFTDADCAPRRDWLRHVGAGFAEAEIGAVAGSVTGVFDRSFCELFSSLYTLQTAGGSLVYRAWTPWSGGFPTANLAVRRSLLLKLEGFDEGKTIYGEDYDLCARLYREGAAILYQPDAVVIHHHRATVKGVFRQAYGFGRGHAYLLHRHHPAGLWLEFPRKAVEWSWAPLPGWIDVASPDKKLALLLMSAILIRPLIALLPLYLCWLAYDCVQRARAPASKCRFSMLLDLPGCCC
ncbi:MAG: glycosyltransferase [Nitrospiraceae bacterium]